MQFKEDFLHYIWQFRLFDHKQLRTVAGDPIDIINAGLLNKNAGPDFSNAKIRIGDTAWAGNVEIHIRSSDWLLHNHQSDAAYNNVILHVVYQDDQPVYLPDGSLLPVLCLENRIPNHHLENYEQLITAPHFFPCEPQLKAIDPLVINSQLTRSLLERLIQKSETVYTQLEIFKGDWDETFYYFMARNFGFKVNAIPFELLAAALPRQLLAKHQDNGLQIAALIFGQAGFLNQPLKGFYPEKLKQEYQFLRKKYNLKPTSLAGWKFMRMRPQNFPTIRLAQFAALIETSNHLFSKILEIKTVPELLAMFENLPVNDFWKTHYHFNKEAENVSTGLGRASIENILINTVALFLFAYGRYTDKNDMVSRAVKLLENLPAEQNAVIRPYTVAGMEINNAFHSQAVIQLNKYYCNAKKCLNCAIGIKILKR